MKFPIAVLTIAVATVLGQVGPAIADTVLQTRLDNFIQASMEEFAVVPGLGICVVRGDQVVYLKGFGYRDIETKLPVTPETGFYIASSTKPFVGAAASVLALQGRIDLDAPVSRYLPELELPAPLSADDVTLREMLTHRTGVDNRSVQGQLAFKSSLDRSEFFEMMLAQSKPMTKEFAYSNLGYNMFGYVLEAVTGQPWQEVVTETVLRPVGMTHTTTFIEAAAQGNFALPYLMKADEYLSVPMKSDDTMHAAGGLVTTPEDLSRWLIANLNAGKIDGETAIDPEALRVAHASYTTLDATYYRFQRNGYGLGWYHSDFEGELLMHHFGGFSGYHAHMSFMPEHGIGVAVVINTSEYGAGTMAHMIAAYVYESLLGNADVEAEYREELQKTAAQTTARKRFADQVDAGMEIVLNGDIAAGTQVLLSALKEGEEAGVVSEGAINRLGYGLLGKKQVDPAIAVFEYNVEAHPDSPNVYDSLGEAYETAGRLDRAKANYNKAYEIATTRGDSDAELYKNNRNRVAAQLK